MIPVAVLDPVDIQGATVSRVTLNNARQLLKMQVGPGAVVDVTRSNEVIPYIVAVKHPSAACTLPDTPHRWDERKVHVLTTCAGEDVRVKQLVRFFSKLEAKHVSEQTLKKLYRHGYTSIQHVLDATPEALTQIDGVQMRSATRIVSSVRGAVQRATIPEILAANGSLGYGIGKKRIVTLLNALPSLLDASETTAKDIQHIPGFSSTLAKQIVTNLPTARACLAQLAPYMGTSTIPERASPSAHASDLVGSVFVFSGFRDKLLEANIRDRGGTVASSVSSKTTALVVPDATSPKETTKWKKATSMGIPIRSRDDFSVLNK